MEGGSGKARAVAKRLSAPRSLRTTSVAWGGVTLRWAAPKGAKPRHYLVLRDGKSLGRTTRTAFTDTKVKPGTTYRYTVRAIDARNRAGALSPSVRVKVPRKAVLGPPAPAPTTNESPPIATVTPTPLGGTNAVPDPEPASTPTPTATATATPTATATATPTPDELSVAQVDRLFWRAGFGPTQAQRDAWVGKRHAELVDWLLETPSALDESMPKPLTSGGLPIDPMVSDIELELDWIDRMVRAINPLPDRLAFFWHRHWAISRDDGIDYPWVINYRNRLLRYADFGTTPNLTFKDLAYEMTTADSAMSLYLNMNQNVRGKPNENYAREFMELFCLGPKGPDGVTDNYTQDDVAGLAKAFTGWSLNGSSASPDYGKITFVPGRYELSAKSFLGLTQPQVTQAQANAAGFGPARINEAIDQVLRHANHASFLIRKLWAEFIAGPIPQPTLDALVAAYRSSSYQLKPVIRGILMSPLIFESIDEPNLIKPPIVQLAGVIRQLGAPLKHNYMQGAMINMQQRIYRPPNVAGWEGGLSWLNTNTVQGRFDLAIRAQFLRYSNYYRNTETPVPPASVNYPPDVNPETKEAVFDRAYAAANKPWISAASKAAIIDYAGTLPVTNATQRRQRFYAVQALILGGPDGQVM
jgi:uncharacterized protein (DUF1800 family)